MPPKSGSRRTRENEPPSNARRTAKRARVATDEPLNGEGAAPSSAPSVTEASIFEGTTPFVRATRDADFDPARHLCLITWNVAGLRGFLKRGTAILEKLTQTHRPDILCLQETKLSDWEESRSIGSIPGYTFVDSISTTKKGYSGVRTYVREGVPVTHQFGFSVGQPTAHDEEGRVIVTAMPGDMALVNVYVPNAGMTLDRLPYRVSQFDPMMRRLLADLASSVRHKKGLIWTGDLNVAERDYDRFWSGNFKQMQKSPGFTPQERASFRETLKSLSMVDAFRLRYPNAAHVYTFWSSRFNQRAKNQGWRLDYFCVSASLAARVVDCFPLPSYTESDHCPLVLWLSREAND